MKCGRVEWQEAGGHKKSFQYCTDPSGQEILYLRTLPRSFRTQSHWSFTAGHCVNSEQFLRVHSSQRMCNQFTLHHKFRMDTGRTKFEQKTDSILSACESCEQRTQGSWDSRPESTASCTIPAGSVEETSKHCVLGRHQICSKERIKVLSDVIERYHPLRHTPSLLYLESSCDEIWRSHIRESICVNSTFSKDFL